MLVSINITSKGSILSRQSKKELCETSFTVFFDGSFCETCGYYDYYEDLQVLLEDEYGIYSRIIDIRHLEKGDLVRFQLFSNDPKLDS